MPRLSLRAFVVSVSLVFLIGAPVAARADDRDAIRALFDQTEELAGLKDEVAKFNPIAEGFKYETELFGHVKVSLYVYFPDGGAAAPVAALLLPSVALSTIIPPLKGTPMDVTVDDPVVFAATSGFLKVDKMPQGVRERARDLGFADAFPVDSTVTVFGKVAGHQDDALHQVLRLINLNAPLIAGYASASKKIKDPNDKDKKKKLKGSVLSLTLPADAEWNEPLFLKHTTIKRASVQMLKVKEDAVPGTKTDSSILLRINGRGLIGAHAAKEYDLFVEKTFDKAADPKSLGVVAAVNPTGEVELTDFFAVTQALWATLGFPEEMAQGVLRAGHALPLDQIKLRNPYSAKEAFPEVGGLPDFDKVMFAGANPAAEIPGRGVLGKLNKGPLLTVNAAAKVFGLDAAGLEGAFSLTHGIKLDAKAKLPKLGPITVADAAFDTTINLKTAFMKLHVDAVTLGKFDVDVGKEGLSFAILPQCPGKPVGLVASLDGFDLAKDFSVKPRMKDCLTPIIKDLIDDGKKVVEVSGEIGGEAADEAAGIAKAAATEVADLTKKRVAAWGTAIANKTGAKKAVDGAKKAVDSLKSAVSDLEDEISSLTHSIDNLLRKAWAFVKGEVKGKKKERQHKISERDEKRTELAAARQREQQAERAATDVPVPYHDDALRNAQAAELAKRAIMAQQTQFADQARRLTDDLKKPEVRQQLFKVDEIAAKSESAFIAEQKAALLARLRNQGAGGNSKPRILEKGLIVGPGTDSRAAEILERNLTLGDLVATLGSVEAAGQTPLPDGSSIAAGVVGGQMDGLREKLLHQEVPNLPTMAFGKNVLVQTKVQDRTLCLAEVVESGELGLRDCAVVPEQIFAFSDTGQVTAPRARARRVVSFPVEKTYTIGGPSLVDMGGGRVALWTYDWTYDGSAGNLFFYDPLDGLIRGANGKCVVPAPNLGFAACPQGDPSAAAWRLVEADRFKSDSALPRASAGGLRAAAPSATAVPEATNLAPLGL